MSPLDLDAGAPAAPDRATVDWRPTRAAGQARLAAFLPAAGRAYAARRNFDLGPSDRSNVSALSPWLRHRLILEEEVLAATLARHRFASAEKFIQEVFWRAYFKGWLEQRPSVWRTYRAEIDRLADDLEADPALADRARAAMGGATGIACFDAWARELVDTGWLHNHSRMWFASIWIFTLELPWRLGADFFLRHLLDGDPASNTLSWRWVAGLHTKGKTYLARADNIARFTEGRFRPSGLAPTAPALSEAEEHPLTAPPAGDAPPEGPYLLLLTEEDALAESLALPSPPSALVALQTPAARSPWPLGAPAAAFAAGAVADAGARAGETFGLPALRCWAEDAAEIGAAVAAAATEAGVREVVVAHAPQGPSADRLAAARAALEAEGIALRRVSRPYDARAWPHATKGFFKLKEKIPALTRKLGLEPA